MPHNQEMLLNAACLYLTEKSDQKSAAMKGCLNALCIAKWFEISITVPLSCPGCVLPKYLKKKKEKCL